MRKISPATRKRVEAMLINGETTMAIRETMPSVPVSLIGIMRARMRRGGELHHI